MMNFVSVSLFAALLFACSQVTATTEENVQESKEETTQKSYTVPVVDKVLSKEEAESYLAELSGQWKDSVKVSLKKQCENQKLVIGPYSMKIWWATYGEKPSDGRSLYISLHGGGGTTADVNDSQWENQKKLYKPAEGVYLAPRAITNTWDLHFVPEADAFYERIIQMAVTHWDVNPDKVYLMGYSAGGDGVWRLGPRMADHWAAASMMAGHPGDVSLLGLRNTPFMIWCGANDSAYNRNEECAKRIEEMDALQAADPEGYIHEGHIVPGKGHWMARYQRNPYPRRVVWCQGDTMKENFYWLGVPRSQAQKGKVLIATVEGNTVTIEKSDYSTLTVYLNDTLLDLDQPVRILYEGKEIFNAPVQRNANTMRQQLLSRGDLRYAFPARVEVTL